MLPLLLILLPLVFGILSFFFKRGRSASWIALATASALTGIGIYAAFASKAGALTFSAQWLPQMGASFSLLGDGMSTMLTALTGIVLLATMISQQNKTVENPGAFYGLMLLSIAGINGVFLASDALLFYFFWELALIPVYFLCSRWGGERRIPITFKFFVYTFAGSLQCNTAGIHDADDGKRDDEIAVMCRAERQHRKRPSYYGVDAHLYHQRRENDGNRRRRNLVGIRLPGVEGEDWHLYRKSREEHREKPELGGFGE